MVLSVVCAPVAQHSMAWHGMAQSCWELRPVLTPVLPVLISQHIKLQLETRSQPTLRCW